MDIVIYIGVADSYKKKIEWLLNTLSQYADLEIDFTSVSVDGGVSIGFNNEYSIETSAFFWDLIENGDFTKVELSEELYIMNKNSNPDYLATAFYFLNCLWEHREDAVVDRFGRHEFQHSIWNEKKLGQPVNIVNKCFNSLLELIKLPLPTKNSLIHLSHDIDTVYGSLMQDGFSILRKKQFDRLFDFSRKSLFSPPLWLNFKKIANIESQRNYTSSFFWLVNSGSTKYKVKNADYKINNSKIVKEINWLDSKGFENGLHKSISRESHAKEALKLPFNNCISNRNHFLKFNFKDLITSIEESEIKVDYSLGYAERIGYRNGYSLPFIPYNLKEDRPSCFVEVPLTIMDGTLSGYLKLDGKEAYKITSNFIEDNKTNSVISILWHNSHFTNYKYEGYPSLYENILDLCLELRLKSINSSEIISSYLSDI